MKTANTALDIYNSAEARFNLGKATKVDEVVLALWDQAKEQAQTIREMAVKISLLEMQKDSAGGTESFTALMGRICSKPTQTIPAYVPTLKIA